MRLIALAWFLMIFFSSACAIFHDDAATLLGRGRYSEALEELVSKEISARDYPSAHRTRYALYRGLAHMALGDAPATVRWLSEAKARFDADPTLLSSEDSGRLRNAWASLGQGW